MTLSCSCDWNDDIDAIWSKTESDYSTAPSIGRRRRCTSCGALIDHGAVQLVSHYSRLVRNDIEAKIYGDDGRIQLANRAMCERCADLYFSFQALGFECVSPMENMLDLCAEYEKLTASMRESIQHKGSAL